MVGYWIRHKDHSDIFSEGYVGISSNHVKRWKDHEKNSENPHLLNAILKYGWDNIIKEIIVKASKEYCIYIEEKLRPSENLGWNIAKGGGMPPKMFGNTFNLGRSGPLHPLWGTKRPDLSLRNKVKIFEGVLNGRYLSPIEAINLDTKESVIFHGAKELRLAGFSPPAVYNCLNPNKIHNKTHKNHIFKRLEK